ncbi:MAG: DUF58 domain-containing protein [Victivallales bacterium]|jgi:uncharacterized protein (DUF58 family)|nr:DUF58 domain-containing protein [Victivallales bacterium]
MLPPEIAKQIRLLEIRTNRMVEEITGGAYRSAFKGRGIEFDEVREYAIEDDIRDIDWNVSARMGVPYVKKYVEERELTVLLLVDVSASGGFGSAERNKRQTAAELAAILAFSAGRNGDKVGLLMFSDRIELYVPPKSGRSHTLRLIREMLAFEPTSKGTDINLALNESAGLLKKRSVVFLLSDLIDERDFEFNLKTLNRKHDVIAIGVADPIEKHWPSLLPVVVEDAESGNQLYFAGGDRALKKLDAAFDSATVARREICRRAHVDLVEIGNNGEVLPPMIEFFSRRRRRRAARW